jgi:hypothetical protein
MDETPIQKSFSDSEHAPPAKVATVLNKILPLTSRSLSSRGGAPERSSGKLQQVGRQVALLSRGAKAFSNVAKEPKPLISLAELRRRLLQRFENLQKAFTSLEQCIESGPSPMRKSRRSMSVEQFAQALEFFGLEASQSCHFFHLMDYNGDGVLTLTEFKKALIDMPREVLLRDLRQRLLVKYQSLPLAFKKLLNCDDVGRSRPLDRIIFASKLQQWGVDGDEAQSLFNLIDADQSGNISLEEVLETLREVAPWTSLDEFWHRFALQWPDIAECAGGGAQARRKGTAKLFALIPSSHHVKRKELPESLSSCAFDKICMQLDISRSNSVELFTLCATSAKWQCRDARRADAQMPSTDCDVDDFFDCLHLWSENPLNNLIPQGRSRGGENDVKKYLAPVRCALKALKGQLASCKR